VQAQDPATIQFADFPERLPKPLASLDETFAAYGSFDHMQNEIGYANKEIEGNLGVIYTPLFDLFRKRAAEKSLVASLSKEEQNMLRSFQMGNNGASKDGEVYMFRLVMSNNRPLISSGKLSWTKVSAAASPSIQKLYQQLKAVEGQMDWAGFAQQADEYKLKFGGSEDEKMQAEKEKFDAAFEKLPKKKVKLMEGFYDDVQDPEKAIALYEQYRTSYQAAAEQRYQTRYKWWMQQYEKLAAISKQMDGLAKQTSQLVAEDADRSIWLPVADLQGRTWEAWQRLTAVTQGLFMDVTLATVVTQQIGESIKMFQKYKEGSE
jgi:hypothetical protein